VSIKLSEIGKQKSKTKTGIVHTPPDVSGKITVRSKGRNVKALPLGPRPEINARVVVVESGGEHFIVGSDELRKSMTRVYVIDG